MKKEIHKIEKCKYCNKKMLNREEIYRKIRTVINQTRLLEYDRQFYQGNYLPKEYELICYNLKCSKRKGGDKRVVYNININEWRLV